MRKRNSFLKNEEESHESFVKREEEIRRQLIFIIWSIVLAIIAILVILNFWGNTPRGRIYSIALIIFIIIIISQIIEKIRPS